TESGHRKVPIPLNTLEQLKTFHDEMNSYFDKHELPKSDLIFPTIYGNFMCDRNERATLKKRLAGIGLPDYGFHIFRHTHASIMLNAGANWKELQVRMGHKSITTTMDAYAELAPKKKAEAVNIFLEKLSLLSA
ncbi:MAG: tyrosine-type recombinase/integrase, partial [Lactococcus lactis]|nr:tyrosine-type recombinase/integrase [Lactococcus lactis]